MLCNVEIFDRKLNCKYHDVVELSSIDDDYLSPSETRATLAKTNSVSKNDYIYVTNDFKMLGVVSTVDTNGKYSTSIGFKPFISMFSQEVLFDKTLQSKSGGKSLEDYIFDTMKTYWVYTDDEYQKIPALELHAVSDTYNWKLELDEDKDSDTRYEVINFYDDVISVALQKYGIAVIAEPDFTRNKIDIYIKKITDKKIVEVDLDSISLTTFKYKDLGDNVNKLEIWNEANYTEKIYYYLHSDLSYSTVSTDRIEPVVLNVSTVSVDDGQTFAQAALEEAINVFSGIEWDNLIEIQVGNDDTLVNPLSLKFGQQVVIYHDGSAYTSILTEKKYGNVTTLCFGTIRIDLTKKIKMKG